jgi:2,5-dihydroxypyridine 5,6-dioxygenase
VSSAGGTDLTFDLTDTNANGQKGYADQAGTWDHWPSALVTGYPVDDRAHGTLVLSSGDVVLPFNRYVDAPVTMRIAEGFIDEIDGELDAAFVRDYLESFNDREVYRTSHIGFGMHPAAQWNALSFYDRRETMGMDARCFRGGFLFSTGPNRFTGRYIDAHLDIPMRGCTVTLDGEVVLDAGVLVGAES